MSLGPSLWTSEDCERPGSSLMIGEEDARTVDEGDADEGPPGEASEEGTAIVLVGVKFNGLAMQSCQMRSGS